LTIQPHVLPFVVAFSLSISGCSGNAVPELGPVGPFGLDSGPSAADGSDSRESDDVLAVDARDAVARPESGPMGDAGAETDGSPGDANSGASDSSDAARPALCIRLYDPTNPDQVNKLAEQVEGDFFDRVYRDCDVSKMVRTEVDTLFNFANDLLLYSLDLWGCSKHPVMDFGLARTEFPDLTSADVARLIDHYMAAATKVLRLDAGEAAHMRADLTRLGALAVKRQSTEFALSMCTPDGGGDGDAPSPIDGGGNVADGGGDTADGGVE
jgi:hypothetical protein